MENLAVLGAGALAIGFTIFIADVLGLILGLGLGHYSKRKAERRKLEETNSND